jgi:hypothetical protein
VLRGIEEELGDEVDGIAIDGGVEDLQEEKGKRRDGERGTVREREERETERERGRNPCNWL